MPAFKFSESECVRIQETKCSRSDTENITDAAAPGRKVELKIIGILFLLLVLFNTGIFFTRYYSAYYFDTFTLISVFSFVNRPRCTAKFAPNFVGADFILLWEELPSDR